MEMVSQYLVRRNRIALVQHIQRREMDIGTAAVPHRQRRRPQVPYPPPLIATNINVSFLDTVHSSLGLHPRPHVLVFNNTSAPLRSNTGHQMLLQKADVGAAAARRARECNDRGCRISKRTVRRTREESRQKPRRAASDSEEVPGVGCGVIGAV